MVRQAEVVRPAAAYGVLRSVLHVRCLLPRVRTSEAARGVRFVDGCPKSVAPARAAEVLGW